LRAVNSRAFPIAFDAAETFSNPRSLNRACLQDAVAQVLCVQ
jgi:hypothetical protein